MDDKRFDDIIKSKAESFEDLSSPTGGEMARLFDDLPASSYSPSWFSSTTNRVVTVAASTLLILTVFLVYRTIRLEENFLSIQEELRNKTLNQGEITYLYDTTRMDSLASQNVRLIGQLDSLLLKRSKDASTSEVVTSSMTSIDSQELADQIMSQLIKEIQENPELRRQIQEHLGQDKQMPDKVSIVDLPEESEMTKAFVSANLTRQEKEDLLKVLIRDPEEKKVLENLLVGNDPQDTDALSIDISAAFIGTLTNRKKQELFEDYLGYNPQKVAEASATLQQDSSSLSLINQYAAAHKLEGKGYQYDSLSIDDRPVLAYEDVREEQSRARYRSISVGAGLGTGVTPFELGNTQVNSYKVLGEYKPNEKIGISAGLEYYLSEVETNDVNSVDFSVFENAGELSTDDAREFKLNITWVDIPLEARVYLNQGKFSPYALVSVRARALLKESYTLEGPAGYQSPSFESEHTFVAPTFGYGLGGKFYLKNDWHGAIQLHHSIGGEGMGVYEDNLNTIQLQGILFFDLK